MIPYEKIGEEILTVSKFILKGFFLLVLYLALFVFGSMLFINLVMGF